MYGYPALSIIHSDSVLREIHVTRTVITIRLIIIPCDRDYHNLLRLRKYLNVCSSAIVGRGKNFQIFTE